MKNLILLFTLVFAFGFTQSVQAQPVPGDVVNETQVEKPKRDKTQKGTKTTKKNCDKTQCCKGEKGKKAKAKKAKYQPKNEEHRYHKATGKHGHGKAKTTNKGKTTCERKATDCKKPQKGKKSK